MSLTKTVYARITNPAVPGTINIASDPVPYTNKVIQTILSIFIIISIVYFVFRFILGGLKIISSNGDPKKYEEAIDNIKYSLIGLVVIFSVFVIVKLLGTIFGISGLSGLSMPWPTL